MIALVMASSMVTLEESRGGDSLGGSVEDSFFRQRVQGSLWWAACARIVLEGGGCEDCLGGSVEDSSYRRQGRG